MFAFLPSLAGAAVALGLAATLAACGGDAGTAPGGATITRAGVGESPYATATSDGGELTVTVRTGPEQPPQRGRIAVELTVVDREGQPVSGLAVDLLPFMPAMGHGSATTPTVREEQPGSYVAEAVDLYMAGTWELRATFRGPLNDRVTIPLQVR